MAASTHADGLDWLAAPPQEPDGPTVSRAQVDAALRTLGLDPQMTYTVEITPDKVQVVTVATEGGVPQVRNGVLGYVGDLYVIEDPPSDPA